MNFVEKYRENSCASYLSDIGNLREINEDYINLYERDNLRLYVIADGMGGHNAGDVASKIAVESCIEYIKGVNSIKEIEKVLNDAISYANKAVYEKSKESNKLTGMGTTITACLIIGEDVAIANVGDSSCYIINDKGIEKVTKDHSLVQELIDEGSITEKEALNHPNKNIITRALGTSESVEIDIFKRKLRGIKKIILCTDGLTNEVNKEEMYDIILKNNNEKACKILIELSKTKGGRDNISVIVFEGECEDDRDYAGK